MRKTLLSLALLVVSGVAAHAQHMLRVSLTNGDETVFVLDKQPEISFTGSKLTVTAAAEQPVSFELDDVASIDLPGMSGLDTAEEAVAGITVSADAAGVTFGNIPAGSHAAVYTASGEAVMSRAVSGTFAISRGELAPGVYIVKIDNFVTKLSL